jgi:predicted membrane chloride channel (bestrophin family)
MLNMIHLSISFQLVLRNELREKENSSDLVNRRSCETSERLKDFEKKMQICRILCSVLSNNFIALAISN